MYNSSAWVPVRTMGNPKTSGPYLATLEDVWWVDGRVVHECIYNANYDKWYFGQCDDSINDNVIAWVELPEAYKGE